MKKEHCFLLAFSVLSGLAYSQEGRLVRTEPDGVQVYEAQGVEPFVSQSDKPVVKQPAYEFKLSDLTITELEERLIITDKKLAGVPEGPEGDADRQRYQQARAEVVDRIKTLNNSN